MNTKHPESMISCLAVSLNCLRADVVLMKGDGGASGDSLTRRVAYQAEHVLRVLDGESHVGSWLNHG